MFERASCIYNQGNDRHVCSQCAAEQTGHSQLGDGPTCVLLSENKTVLDFRSMHVSQDCL